MKNSIMKNPAHPVHSSPRTWHVLTFILVITWGLLPAFAQTHQTDTPAPQAGGFGSISGRIYYPAQDQYMVNVQVTLEGTNRVTFTDSLGTYYFANVPAGAARVKAGHAGFVPGTGSVTVETDKTATLDIDISMADSGKSRGRDEIVMLEAFVVTGQTLLGAAIAEQDQRHAIGMTSVVSTDQYGPNATGNIGEFMRNIAGVSVGVGDGGDAGSISLSGAGAGFVPVTLGGMEVGSVSSGGNSRSVELQQLNLNGIARIEITFARRPDVPGKALKGSVNAVPRGAFEQKKPSFSFNTNVIFHNDEFTVKKTSGPLYEPTRKVKPSWDFAYIVPVNRSFGFTLSGFYTFRFNMDVAQTYNWRGIEQPYSRDPAGFFPPPNVANPYAAPYASNYGSRITSNINDSTGGSLSLDWRISRLDRLRFDFSYQSNDRAEGYRTNEYKLEQGFDTANSTPTHFESTGYLRIMAGTRRRQETVLQPHLHYWHLGSLWKIEAAASMSRADQKYTDISNGYFRSTYADRFRVKIIMDKDAWSLVPNNIEVTDTYTLNPVDSRSLDEYIITDLQSRPEKTWREGREAMAYAQRTLSVFGVPSFLKAGFHLQQELRDYTNTYTNYYYLGPDGNRPAGANGIDRNPDETDQDAGPFADSSFTQTAKLLGSHSDYPHTGLMYNLYQQHPDYFETTTPEDRARYSRHAEETVSAGYLRAHFGPWITRLGDFELTGGTRYEKTHVIGIGGLQVPRSGDTAAYWLERGTKNTVDFDHWFRSVNASWRFGAAREWILRAAWFTSIGRPNFEIYNGTIILPDPLSMPTSTSNRIELAGNSLLKPWTARTLTAQLEYYSKWGGWFRMTLDRTVYINRFYWNVYPLTEELRQQYDIGPEYMGFYVSVQRNSEYDFTTDIFRMEFSQTFDKFLPKFIGARVGGSGEWRAKEGVDKSKMVGSEFAPRAFKANAELRFRRAGREILRLGGNMDYTSEYVRDSMETAMNLEPGVMGYRVSFKRVNVFLEIPLSRKLRFIASCDNVTDDAVYDYAKGPSTPNALHPTWVTYYGRRFNFFINGRF
jgi:TonB-dependent receptor